MSTQKMIHEIAREVRAGDIARSAALKKYGGFLDSGALDDALALLNAAEGIRHEKDGTMVLPAPDQWFPAT